MRSFSVFQHEPDGDKNKRNLLIILGVRENDSLNVSYKALANGFNSFMRSSFRRCL
jgi:hypothetical protein